MSIMMCSECEKVVDTDIEEYDWEWFRCLECAALAEGDSDEQ